MKTSITEKTRSVSWGNRAVTLALVVALLLPTLMLAPTAVVETNAEPAILTLAAEQPQASVRIITRPRDNSVDMRALVEEMGGTYIKELSLINAFVAEMSAVGSRELAANPAVAWVSLDAPIASASYMNETVRDDFKDVAYDNNDGSQQWAGPWIEFHDNNEPDSGAIRVEDHERLRIEKENRSIQRMADLSLAQSATFSFEYRREKMESEEGYLAVEVSADSGQTWTMVDSYDGQTNDRDYVSVSYDISSAISANTTIRFRTSPDFLHGKIKIRKVEISYTVGACNNCDQNTYLETLNVQSVWEMGYLGDGVTVAVIDSGIAPDDDFETITDSVAFGTGDIRDYFGHGTHVAGIITGNGRKSGGWYQGIAPKADLINIAISDQTGMAYESDVVDAIQWVYDNRDVYNIRIVNMSFNSTAEQSYHNSPIDAAAEILWFNGIVVVASSGNKGTGDGGNTANSAPANDPFIITVGASNEQGTADRADDTEASFSASATTIDGFEKPELLAPGKNIVSVLSANSGWKDSHPERVEDNGQYFRLSGTSMSAPMVSGAAALLLESQPKLTPDQVKYRLMYASGTVGSDLRQSYPYLDVYALITTDTTESANTGLIASNLLTTGSEPVTSSVSWNSVSWNSVSWNSVSWNSVSWNSVSWNSVSWNSVSWND